MSTAEDLTTESPICEERGGEERGRRKRRGRGGKGGEGERGRRKRRGSPLAIARRLALFPGIDIGANAQLAVYS